MLINKVFFFLRYSPKRYSKVDDLCKKRLVERQRLADVKPRAIDISSAKYLLHQSDLTEINSEFSFWHCESKIFLHKLALLKTTRLLFLQIFFANILSKYSKTFNPFVYFSSDIC